MKKLLKGAVVLLITLALFLSTSVSAETVKNTQVEKAYIKTTNANPSDPVITPVFGPVIFSQKPYEPEEDWGFYTSTASAGYICADDFWEITEPICDIHWWGLSLFYTGSGWLNCDPTGMIFEIIFYDMSGAPVCVYQVQPPAVGTGKYYSASNFEMYYWETDLDPCCQIDNGWVSIQCIQSPNECYFLWAGSPEGNFNGQQNWVPIDPEDNLAFELTAGGEPCEPGIDVEKYVLGLDGKWVDADTEDTALDLPICHDGQFKIVIKNTGDCALINIVVKDIMHESLKYTGADPEPDSVTHTEPEWVMEWMLPGPLAAGDSIIIFVNFHVEGPECSVDYNHVLVEGFCEECPGIVVNDEDWCWVHAYKKSKDLNMPFLQFLQSYPNLFPILQKLLKTLGL
jgi:hypothetical protein